MKETQEVQWKCAGWREAFQLVATVGQGRSRCYQTAGFLLFSLAPWFAESEKKMTLVLPAADRVPLSPISYQPEPLASRGEVDSLLFFSLMRWPASDLEILHGYTRIVLGVACQS